MADSFELHCHHHLLPSPLASANIMSHDARSYSTALHKATEPALALAVDEQCAFTLQPLSQVEKRSSKYIASLSYLGILYISVYQKLCT